MPKRAREDLLIKISGLDLDYAFSTLEVLKNNVKETNGNYSSRHEQVSRPYF
jgi:hypothetical protein